MSDVKQKILAAFFCLLIGGLEAQPLEYRVTLGGRGAALGESAIALSPSPLSVYYNPAALGFMQQGGFLVDYSNLFGANIHEGVAAAATPIPLPYGRDKQGGFGFMVNFQGFDDSEVRIGRTIVSSALGLPLTRRLALGANFKVVLKNAQLENIGNAVNGSGTGLDLALHYQWPLTKQSSLRQIDLAVVAYDVYDTRVGALLPGSTDLVFQRAVRGGAALHFRDLFSRRSFALRRPTLLMQFDDRWHLGGEVTLLNTLALRAGYAHDLGDPGESILTFGFGLDLDERAGNVQFDYAYIHTNSLLPNRHLFTLQAPMFKGPPEVAIAEPQIAPIFASYFLSYPNSSAAQHNSVQIENLTNTTITGRFTRLQAPWGIGLDEKATAAFSLQPGGEPCTVRLPFKIASDILQTKDLSQPVQAKLHFEFATSSHPNKRRRVEKDLMLVVHGKNYLTWDELARAAAFITPNDRRVQALRERAAQFLADPFWQYYRPIYRAAQFYEALIENGVTYLPDTRLRFDSLYAARGFDKIKYPGETLAGRAASRRGDCDDLMALYAALLESDNIATALVGASDHVLLLFDTGIPLARRSLLPLPDSLLLQFANAADLGLNDRVWLPVEVTAIGRGRAEAQPFPQAIVQGATFIREAQKTDSLFEIVSTSLAWEKFRAALPPDSSSTPPNFLAAGERVKSALSGLNRFRNDHIRTLVSTQALNNETGLAAGIQHASLCAYLENYPKADSILLALGKRFGERYEVLNNRGNLALLNGQYGQAGRFYAQALQRKPDFLQGYLNRMLLDTLRIELGIGDPDSLRGQIERDSRRVEALYKDKDSPYLITGASLEQLQGLILPDITTQRGAIEISGRSKTKAPPKPTVGDRVKRAGFSLVRYMSNRLKWRADPTLSSKISGRGKGKNPALEDMRVVDLLYWSL